MLVYKSGSTGEEINLSDNRIKTQIKKAGLYDYEWELDESELKILFYEGGGESLKSIIPQDIKSVSVYIGPEGGFEESEVELIKSAGGKIASLGPRILRTQTAPVTALSAIMLLTGNLE